MPTRRQEERRAGRNRQEKQQKKDLNYVSLMRAFGTDSVSKNKNSVIKIRLKAADNAKFCLQDDFDLGLWLKYWTMVYFGYTGVNINLYENDSAGEYGDAYSGNMYIVDDGLETVIEKATEGVYATTDLEEIAEAVAEAVEALAALVDKPAKAKKSAKAVGKVAEVPEEDYDEELPY